jgi:hypothetical protein
VISRLDERQHLIQPRLKDFSGFPVRAPQPEVSTNGVRLTSSAELSVAADQNGLAGVGPDSQVVVLRLSQPNLRSSKALVAAAAKHASDFSIDVLVEEEEHRRRQALWAEARDWRAASTSAAVKSGKASRMRASSKPCSR